MGIIEVRGLFMKFPSNLMNRVMWYGVSSRRELFFGIQTDMN